MNNVVLQRVRSRCSTSVRWLTLGWLVAVVLFGTLRCERVQASEVPTQLQARAGYMDLRAWDFQYRGPINLDGEWEFYAGRLLAPLEFQRARPRPDALVRTPGHWPQSTVLPGGEGCATYRLRVRLRRGEEDLAVRVDSMGTAYRLWLDGREVLASGRVGPDATSSRPQTLPVTQLIRETVPEEFDLIVQVSNFHHPRGGMWHTPRLGYGRDLLREREAALALELFLLGVTVSMALYHFVLFALRPSERTALYFGLFALLFAIRIPLHGEHFLVGLRPGLEWEWQYRLGYLTYVLAVPVFLLFLRAMFPREIRAALVYLMTVPVLIFAVVILTQPVRVFVALGNYFSVGVLLCACLCLVVLLLAVWRRREGAVALVIGAFVLFLTVVNDVLLESGWLQTVRLSSYGLVAFLLGKSASLAERVVAAQAHVEARVVERTRELYSALARVQENDARLRAELDVAYDIQQCILPIMPYRFTHGTIVAHYEPMERVGGDFFDFIPLANRGLAVFFADAAGHGVPGALLTAMAKISFRDAVRTSSTPRDILKHLNEVLNSTLQSWYYLEGCCAVLHPDGTLDLVNASYQYVAVYRKATGRVESYQGVGLYVGLFDYAGNSYEQQVLRLEAGDRVLLYTDGLVESKNSAGEIYGESRLFERFGDTGHLALDAVSESLVRGWRRFTAGRAQEDDVTLLILEYSGQPA